MTEEIIIDGVNVAECEYYFEDNGIIAPDGTPERTDICTSPERHCENNDSCYCNKQCNYKQLQRLKQENEKLKEKLENEEYNACCECTNIQNQNDNYRKALEEIREKFLNQVAWVGGLSKFEEEIYNKINEVLG